MMKAIFIVTCPLTFILMLSSCSNRLTTVGEYQNKGARIDLLHLSVNGTGYYTWWTDIKMINNGKWRISNDTLFFTDEAILHRENKVFTLKGNKLTDSRGVVYRKLNCLQRKLIYRGR